jgi:hypothetical protein
MPPLDTAREVEVVAYNRTEQFAAEFTGTRPETLRTWRRKGSGPPWKKINGKLIRYSLAGLIAWMESQPGGGETA